MANAQLNDIPLGMATPSRESDALDSEDHRVIDENVSFTAVAVETDKVVESLGSSHKARRNISSRQDDEMSLVDGTEEDVRQSWSDLDTKNPKRKRDDSVPSRKGRKWNARLERSKINTQLRILDVMGPLSRLWSEAHRIKKDNQGMDPSDVIQLTQRAIVLAGNAHYVYNTDRRKKAMLVKTMPDSLDFLNEKKGKKALAKSKGQLFGNKFLKSLAKENKDNKELREMLLFSNKKKHAGKPHFNRKNDQFFQQGPTNNLQSVGGRQALHPQVSGKRPWQGNQSQNRQGNSYGQRQNQRQNQTQNQIQTQPQNNQVFKKPANR
ncbi:Hypothetical predicted protein [Mytilus galloprovincialis]|uniref:Uncharacterized protein n=1 Tax=Mytilus galloprovincialis TaxID=29158 RepID=A0A8B6D4J6_MYTGA|nr:Hypothetical predicted protein [Mytilus galloprovincialis]